MSDPGRPTTLTDEQQAAIHAPITGTGKITAGAGSGKTEVLTARIGHILREGRPPEQVTAITYTNKAAAALKSRLIEKGRLAPEVVQRLEVSTFHAFLSRCLKDDPFAARIAPGYGIMIQSDQNIFLNRLLDWFRETYVTALFSETDGLGPVMVETIVNAFPKLLGHVRRFLLSPREFYRKTSLIWKQRQDVVSPFERQVAAWFFRFYSRYLQALREKTALDFDEILMRGRDLLLDYREHGIQPGRRVFLIDEFQDNNPEQLGLVELFRSSPDFHLTVVGDPLQSIYRFQGAEVSTFTGFAADREFSLSRNFRSFAEILTFADTFAASGQESPRFLSAARGPSPRPQPIACFLSEDRTGREEVAMMVTTIETLVHQRLIVQRTGKPLCFGDIALIVAKIRNQPSIKILEDELAAKGIPYILSGGLGFYDLSEIHELLAFFRLMENPALDHALLKILTGPVFGVCDSETARLAQSGRREKTPLLPHLLSLPATGLPGGLRRFREFFVRFQGFAGKTDILDLVYRLLDEGGYREFAAAQSNTLKRRRLEANFAKFIGIVRQFQTKALFSSFRDFLAHVDYVLESGIDEDAADLGLDDSAAIKIMTIHKAKGLEFPVVFLPFVRNRAYKRLSDPVFDRREGLLVGHHPDGSRADSDAWQRYHAREEQAHGDEERRKWYVAATRAEELLIISGSLTWRSGNPLLAEWTGIIADRPDIGQAAPVATASSVISAWLSSAHHPSSQPVPETPPLPPQSAADPTSAVPADISASEPEQPSALPLLAQAIRRLSQAALAQVEPGADTPTTKTGSVFSLQDFALFEQCPRRYFQRKLSMVTMDPHTKDPAAELGNLVHRTIVAARENRLPNPETPDASQALRQLISHIASLMGLSDSSGGELAYRILSTYFRNPLGQKEPTLLEAEVHVRFDPPSGPFFVRGFSDRVDFDSDGVKIFDYKVHRHIPDRHLGYARQLSLYQLAAVRGVLGERGRLNFPDARIVYLTEHGVEIVPSDVDVHAFEKWVIKTATAIREESQWPTFPGDHCLSCESAILCPGIPT